MNVFSARGGLLALFSGHLKRAPSSGHLLRGAHGHLANACGGGGGGCPCPAAQSCGSCLCTPASFTVTFSNVAIATDCISCPSDGTAARGQGTLNGTYCLTQTAACLWTGAAANLAAQIGADCASLNSYTPQITLNRLDATHFKLYVDNVQRDFPVSTLFFYDIFETAVNDCSSGWTVGSSIAGRFGGADCTGGLDTYYLGGNAAAGAAAATITACC